MTTIRQQYLDLQTQLNAIEDTFLAFQSDLLETEDSEAVDEEISSVVISLHNIGIWLLDRLGVQNEATRDSED